MRFVANDELIEDLSKQGTLQVFIEDVDRLYADFRKRFRMLQSRQGLTDKHEAYYLPKDGGQRPTGAQACLRPYAGSRVKLSTTSREVPTNIK